MKCVRKISKVICAVCVMKTRFVVVGTQGKGAILELRVMIRVKIKIKVGVRHVVFIVKGAV